LLERLKNYLRGRRQLLFLDNFEHVAQASPVVTDLLRACPPLKVLVTSWAVLHLSGEHEYPVPPLELPDPKRLPGPEGLSRCEAVALFVERARAVKPDFQLTEAAATAVAEICLRLDGLPLAIELAAARVKLLPPDALLARLEQRLPLLTGEPRDLPARQRTLRDTSQWSQDLLGEEEQRLFRRFSVFVGGCTLRAVEAVAGTTGEGKLEVLNGVASLVDKNLVRQVERFYSIADTTCRFNGYDERYSTPRPSQPTLARQPTSRVVLKTEIVVIGAGQAGLSSAYHLKKRRLASSQGFIVLDQSPQPGGAWQFRWPSLKLSTVNRIHDLPGMRFSEAVDTEATEVEASVAVPRYFAAYEEAFDLPAYRPAKVTVVCDRGERLRIETNRGSFSARGVINATGTWEAAYIPEGRRPRVDGVSGRGEEAACLRT
jgi:hypothetical protein